MKKKANGEPAPAQCGQHTPTPRDGSALNWLVVNPDGKLLAILDSESEAYWFTRNRGHADGAVFFRASCDYAAAPALVQALQGLAEMAEEARQQVNACATACNEREMEAACAVVRGWCLSITDKARAALAQAQKEDV